MQAKQPHPQTPTATAKPNQTHNNIINNNNGANKTDSEGKASKKQTDYLVNNRTMETDAVWDNSQHNAFN